MSKLEDWANFSWYFPIRIKRNQSNGPIAQMRHCPTISSWFGRIGRKQINFQTRTNASIPIWFVFLTIEPVLVSECKTSQHFLTLLSFFFLLIFISLHLFFGHPNRNRWKLQFRIKIVVASDSISETECKELTPMWNKQKKKQENYHFPFIIYHFQLAECLQLNQIERGGERKKIPNILFPLSFA